jgi:acid phosphatase type 7
MEEENASLLPKPSPTTSKATIIGFLISIFVLLVTFLLISQFAVYFIVTFLMRKPTIHSSHGIIKSRNNVTFTLENVNPQALDWIGIYTPPDTPDGYPVQWRYLNRSNSLTFDLINFRKPYEIRLFRNTTFELITKTNINVDVNYPTQIHLSLTEKPHEMRVMWISGYNGTSTIMYRKEGDEVTLVEIGTSETYTREEMCHEPANLTFASHGRGWWDPGFIHTVHIKNLEPNKKYFYKVGNDLGEYSQEHSFLGPRNPDDMSMISLMHVGDLGSYINGWTTPRFFNTSYNGFL